MFKRAKQRLKQFITCTDGNVGIIFGAAAIPMLVGAGSAIDYARYTDIRAQAQVALDSAILAATASLKDDTDVTDADINAAKAIGKKQFTATLGTQKAATVNEPTFVKNATGDGLEATVTGSVDNQLLTFAGITDLAFSLESEAVFGQTAYIGSDVEVALMLDVTGSMCGSSSSPCTSASKITALKDAAKDLIDTVVWDDQSENTAKVSIVPFSSRVRLAADGQAGALFTAATGMPATWAGYIGYTDILKTSGQSYNSQAKCQLLTNWVWKNSKCYQRTGNYVTGYKAKPCVTERYNTSTGAYGFTEATPANGTWSNGNDGTRRPTAWDSNGLTFSPNGSTQFTYMSSMPATYSTSGACDANAYWDSSDNSGKINNKNVVVPLSDDTAMLKSKIDNLVAEGGTAGSLGTAWAWYTISPVWSSIWGSDSAPQAYSELTTTTNDKPNLYKIAILMTDGEYNTLLGGNEVNGSSVSVTSVENNAKSICTNMKAQGIEVYTIGFELDSTSGKAMLKNCATDDDHFYDASDPAKLQAAFDEIAKRILTQAGKDLRLAR
jgi:Flp pilus assembly protein TadG